MKPISFITFIFLLSPIFISGQITDLHNFNNGDRFTYHLIEASISRETDDGIEKSNGIYLGPLYEIPTPDNENFIKVDDDDFFDIKIVNATLGGLDSTLDVKYENNGQSAFGEEFISSIYGGFFTLNDWDRKVDTLQVEQNLVLNNPSFPESVFKIVNNDTIFGVTFSYYYIEEYYGDDRPFYRSGIFEYDKSIGAAVTLNSTWHRYRTGATDDSFYRQNSTRNFELINYKLDDGNNWIIPGLTIPITLISIFILSRVVKKNNVH